MCKQVLEHLTADQPAAIDRLKALLAIPSVSADPTYSGDVAAAGQWLVDQLSAMGLDAQLVPTAGHPIVFARSTAATAPPDAPHLLYYAHYDVQPPDPLDKWDSPPFEPTIRDGAIYARGASDDKGQVCCILEALRAWLVTEKQLPCQVIVLFEGEEESAGQSLPVFIEQRREQLAADVVVVSDTAMWPGPDGPIPAIKYGLRGIAYFDVKLYGPNRDVHSGSYGGAIANPATMLARVLGRLFDDDNHITIPGFYDDVVPVTDQEKRRWTQLPFDERHALKSIGVAEPFGERGYSTLQRLWARPSCDVNGLYGGYQGEGGKTIIPSFAGAKLSFRLVANQDPRKIGAALESWLHSQDVGGCRWQVQHLGQAPPVLLTTDSPFVTAAKRAIERASGRPPVMIREAASIPVVADFKSILGLDTLLIGFGLTDDCIHSPNEKFNLDQFTLGCRTHAILLAELAAARR